MGNPFGLHQLVNETTRILDRASNCIDLIVTFHPKLEIEFRVHSLLHPIVTTK